MIEHMDNFSMYGSNTAFMLNGVYADISGISLVNDPDGISAGKVIQSNGQNISGARYVLTTADTVIGMASRIWLPFLPGGGTSLPNVHLISDLSNNSIASIVVETTGRLSAHAGDRNGTLLGTTANPVVTANGWYHIETKFTIAGGLGAIKVVVEGITVLDLTNVNIGVATCGQVHLGQSPSSPDSARIYFKDFVVWNNNGTYNNDFLGSVVVYDFPPTSDVALNWTPVGAANGFSILDNSPPVDASYIAAPNPPPAAYVAAHGALPADVTSVKAIMTMVRAAKSDGGDATLQIGVISDPSGTPATVLGSDRPITVAQTFWRDIFETDPVTTAPWIPSAVNVSELQINRTT